MFMLRVTAFIKRVSDICVILEDQLLEKNINFISVSPLINAFKPWIKCDISSLNSGTGDTNFQVTFASSS